MQSLTPEQLERLPKYAQHYIAALEQRQAEYRKVIAQLRQAEHPEDSNVRVRHFGEPDQILGKNVPVTFDIMQPHLGKSIPPTKAPIVVRHVGPFTLEVHGDGSGSMHIIPVSSNLIKVRPGSWS